MASSYQDTPEREFPGDTKKLEEEFLLVIVDGLAEFWDEIEDDEGVRYAPLPRSEGRSLGPD